MIKVSDHALVRFLQRSGALDVEQIRALMSGALERGRRSAERAGIADYTIVVDGMKYIVRNDTVVTVLDAAMVISPSEPG